MNLIDGIDYRESVIDHDIGKHEFSEDENFH